VERFLFRPGLQDRARYHAVIFLNQLVLSRRPEHGGPALAAQLVGTYFTVFRLILEGHVGHAAAARAAAAERAAAAKRGSRKSAADKDGKLGKKFGRKGGKQQGGKHGKKGGHAHNHGKGGKASAADARREEPQAAEMDARLLSAILTGVRRAFPYVAPDAVEPLVEAHSAQLFRMIHTAPFSVALQALMLLFQLMSARSAVSDRFYRALYAVMGAGGDGPTASARAPMFLALLYKAMKADVSAARAAAFAKRLLQVACASGAGWAAGALFLLSEVLKAQPALWAAVLQPEEAAAGETLRDAPAGSSDDEEEEAAAEAAPRTREHASAAAGAAGHSGRGPASGWPPADYYDMNKRCAQGAAAPLLAAARGPLCSGGGWAPCAHPALCLNRPPPSPPLLPVPAASRCTATRSAPAGGSWRRWRRIATRRSPPLRARCSAARPSSTTATRCATSRCPPSWTSSCPRSPRRARPAARR